MESFTPVLALILSVMGLTISLLNYLRDQARPRAWCEVVYHHKGPRPDSVIPSMRIRIANLGRRPAVLLMLELRGNRRTWYRPLKDPDLPSTSNDNFHKVIEALEEHALAQNSALRLLEGDVVDLMFWPDDCPDFILTVDGSCATADKIYVQDCRGRRSRVLGDQKALRVMFEAWSSQD